MLTFSQKGFDFIVDCGFDYKLLKQIKRALKVKLPTSQYNPHFGYYRDGYLRLYTEMTSGQAQIKVKRGHIGFVLKFAEERNIEIKYEFSEEKLNFDYLQFSKYLQPAERDYQRNAVEAFLKQGYGIIKVPTRGGKTVIASEIIQQLSKKNDQLKVLFLTDLTDLFNQTVSELEKFLLEEVGEIKGEIFNPKRVTVAMTQTLQSRLKREAPRSARHKPIHNFVKEIGLFVVDECHDFVSKPRLDILRMSTTQWICGLSGTPEKSSNVPDNFKMKGIIGDVVYQIKEIELEERGILSKSKVLLVLNRINCNELEVEYNDFIQKFVYSNEERNFLIACMAQVCVDLNLKVLIMTRSKKHGKVLNDAFGFDYISGDDDPYERNRIRSKIVNNTGGYCAIVTEIWKKGMTLPQAQVLLNITVGREESNVIQKRGRILGAVHGKNKALTIDIVDFSRYYLSDHSYDRINAYEKFTDKNNIHVIDSSNCGDSFLQSFYEYVNRWFYD